MRIARSMLRHGNLMPEALGVIASIPDSLLHHVAHSRRHPASLYTRSLSHVAKNWHAALDKIEEFTSAYLWVQDDSLLPEAVNAYRCLLFALYEHLDASYGCVRALVPPQTKNDPVLDTKFLDRAKVAGWREFRLRIQPYLQNRIGAVVNSLKHNQSEMVSFYLHKLPDLRVGYCIRDVQSTGALGPAIRVHADGNSAFSFARDMLIHFWNLYFISSELADLIRRLTPTVDTKMRCTTRMTR